jgi:hypothetical protein
MEKSLLFFFISFLTLVLLQIQVLQAGFWAFFVAIMGFAIVYGSQSETNKAAGFYRNNTYISVIVIVLGVVAVRFDWDLSWSIVIAGCLSMMLNYFAHAVLTAVRIE